MTTIGMKAKRAVVVDQLWHALLENAGICARNVLRRAELPRDLFTQVHAKLSLEEYFRFWDAMEAEAGDRTLPIRLGQAVTPRIFHPVLFAALCSSNLTDAVRRIGECEGFIAPVKLVIEEEPAALSVHHLSDTPAVVLPSPLAIFMLVFLTQVARIGTVQHICPVKVESPIPIDPAAAYASFFGVFPERSERHGVTFSTDDARRPFLTANESVWAVFEPKLRPRLAKRDAAVPMQERVKSMLLETLPSGEASIEATARNFGLSPRTLQRKLRLEGTSFKEVLNQIREQLARHYLTSTSLTYAEISFLIGFEEPSSFFRAFREWTGKTPAAVRTHDSDSAALGAARTANALDEPGGEPYC